VSALRELLRPPAHRGPLIAAGAVALTVGVALEQLRVSPGNGWQLAIVGAVAALLLWLALQARLEGGHPPAYLSVLAVCGLLLLYIALLRLARVLGADFDEILPTGPIAWTAAVEAAVATVVSARRNSAIAALIAAISGGVAVLAAWDQLFAPASVTPLRWLLLAMAIVFALASLPLRSVSLRHAVQMVNAAGLAILAVALIHPFGGGLFGLTLAELPGFWKLVLLAGGFGLVAYAAVDRAPGPAYLGALVLTTFVVYVGATGDDTLLWWPLVLLALGAGAVAAGLRPRSPLPPEPEPGAYRPDELPLAARADDVTVRVHRD
jgi:hypothetical protein